MYLSIYLSIRASQDDALP